MSLLEKEKEATETRKKEWEIMDGWRPRDDEAKTEFNRAVLQTKEGESQDCLEQDQKMIEEVAKEISHSTKVERDRDARQPPKKNEALEGAAARDSRAVERRVTSGVMNDHGAHDQGKRSEGDDNCR